MDTFFDFLFEQLRNQGFSMTLLFTAIYFIYKDLERQKVQNKAAQEQIVQYLKDDRAKLIQLVQELSDVVDQNTAILKAIEKKL